MTLEYTHPVIDRGDTTVLLAGDWHGNTEWAMAQVKRAAALGVRTIYHLGDFGLWPGPGGSSYLVKIQRELQRADIELFFVPGNHENWDSLNRRFDAHHRPARFADRIHALPRGYRWDHAGRSFVALGGAPSTDRAFRTEGKTWWSRECFTEDDVKVVAAGGYADVFLAHEAPRGWATTNVALVATQRLSDRHITDNDRAYCARGRELMGAAYEAVLPKVFAHGHYHVKDQTVNEHGSVYALDMDGASIGNLLLLDLGTLEATWVR